MSEYLEIPIGTFPWYYNYSYTKNKKILVNTLKLLKDDNVKRKYISSTFKEDDYTLDHLKNRFIRTLPEGIQYEKRLNHELFMIESKKLICGKRHFEVIEGVKFKLVSEVSDLP